MVEDSDQSPTPNEKFFDLMSEIGLSPNFVQIFTAEKDSFDFETKYIDFQFSPSRLNRSGLANRAKEDEWNLIESLSNDGTYLLLPPKTLAATDLSDFCRKHKDRPDWKEICETLFTELASSLDLIKNENDGANYWVYTHGTAEPYLHIRFEPFDRRKYG